MNELALVVCAIALTICWFILVRRDIKTAREFQIYRRSTDIVIEPGTIVNVTVRMDEHRQLFSKTFKVEALSWRNVELPPLLFDLEPCECRRTAMMLDVCFLENDGKVKICRR